jgi:GDP-mannose 6-dehydrogenase
MHMEDAMHEISVFGLGYVGTVLLACLARDGHRLTGVDVDPYKLELLKSGKSPVIEAGLDELCLAALQTGRAKVTNNVTVAVENSDVSFVCVGTPSYPNGSQDNSSVIKVVEEIGDALLNKNSYHVVVIRSTVIPGTVEDRIAPILEERSGKEIGKNLGLCFQPEFLREGSSIKDYDNPPFTIVGGDSERSISVIRELFGDLSAEFIATDIRSAEMVKYCCNAFHAVKITFANEVGRVSRALGIDSRNVMEMVCRDRVLNISPTYLRPGFAFGGSCLPKDLRGLMHAARSHDIEVPMIRGVLQSNAYHIETAVNAIISLGRRPVGLVGLSFKHGTDDLRESPYVTMAERLIGKGWELRIYDPKVRMAQLIGSNKVFIEQTIPHMASLLYDNPLDLIDESDVIAVAHANPDFFESLYSRCRPGQWVLDLTGSVDSEKLGCKYQAICW